MDDRYYNELSKLPVLTPSETRELVIQYRAGDTKAFELIINGNLRLVTHFTKKYIKMLEDHSTLEMSDLIGEGNQGLIDAVERFDTERGVDFPLFAQIYIRKRVTTFLRNNQNTIRIPWHKVEGHECISVRMPEYYDVEDDDYNEAERLIDEDIYIAEVMKNLSNEENEVISKYFGIGTTKQTLLQIGESLGITKQRAWQIKDKALNKIKK